MKKKSCKNTYFIASGSFSFFVRIIDTSWKKDYDN